MIDHLLVGSTIHLVWASNVDHTSTAGTDSDIFHIHYNGSNWSVPVLVNSYGTFDNATDHDERMPRPAFGPDGRLHCVWQSRYPLQGGTDLDVMYASLDGSKWSTTEALTRLPLDEVVPTIITQQNGDPVVVYQNSLGELRYRVWLGNLCSGDTKLYTPLAGLAGTASDPVALTRSSDGLIVAVWSTARDLSGTMGTDVEVVFSEMAPDAYWTSPIPVSNYAYGDTGQSDWDAYHFWVDIPIPLLGTADSE